MPDTTSYTPEEVAKLLKISRFTVYEMIKRGDLAAYRIGRKVRIDAPDLDIYINKSKGACPARQQSGAVSVETGTQETLILCGQDAILDIIARHMEKTMPALRCLRNYSGSIDGLLALYRGTANAVTAHLWDSDTDSYNVPYVRRILPGHKTIIINLVYRTEGFYVAKGNPKQLLSWQDLIRPDIRLVNREPGSGARVLLDEELRLLQIDSGRIPGYDHEETSHLAIASCVARGEADVGVGIEKVALQVAGIDFMPLQKERYDLVIRKTDIAKPHFQTLLNTLQSAAFRIEIAGMGGYDVSHMGEIMAET
ncbi:Hypothetical protein LUCI_2933 [Lucifera butyrica]|uniref:Helix-turn-helix domain-containing protein n=1 Tax=Lucifera butyrica TaxID=1351585 RepID=A0A498RER3_9FIRM|nr:helix-turn-helix transcriptional regulator [Lucifera butyrica]VBB07668.1 Hypothetical protein LUCI_2933 [Lucifera butyrica]